jgi:ATP-binding cassette, subfamily B, bacterial
VNSMMVLLRLVRYSPRYFVGCVAFAIVMFVIVPVPIGLAARAFFDALSDGSIAWSALLVIVLLQIIEVAIDPALGNPWNSVQQKSQVLLQRNLFASILRSYGRHGLLVSTGEAISRFRDDPRGIADGLDALCDLIGRSVFAVLATVVMWRINAGLTLVLLGPLLASTWLSEALGTRTIAYRAAAQSATSRVTGFLGELLSGQLALIVAGATAHAVTRLRDLGETRRRMAVRDSVFDVLLDSFSMNLAHIGTGLVLLLGARAIAGGAFTVGDFALFVVYLEQLIWYPAEIARLISDLKRIDVSFGRIRAMVPEEPPNYLLVRTPLSSPSLDTDTRAPFELLEVSGLSYIHPDGTLGIADGSFTLRRGSITVITGRVGGGKSTLLRALLGLVRKSSGEIRWNGQLVEDPATFFVPPRSAYTPQVPRLFSESLRDNLLLGRQPELLSEAIHAAVLESDVDDLEHGLDTLVGPRGVKLSGGQIQRAALARMFVTGSELLVMDDVSSALDMRTEAELWTRLLAQHQSITCLVVSHRPTVLAHADQVLELEDGRLARMERRYNRELLSSV